MTAVRRSGRARKQATSVYDDAKKKIEEEKERREAERSDDDEEEEEEERDDEGGITDDASDNEEAEEEEDDDDDDSEEDDDEEFQAKPRGARGARKVSPAAKKKKKKQQQTPAKRGKKVQIQVKPSRKRRSPAAKKSSGAKGKGGGSGSGSGSGSGPIGRRGINSALATLGRKVLDESETTANSLVAGLLNAHKKQQSAAAPCTSECAAASRPITVYTPNLTLLARSVVSQHNAGDPNAAQVRLINLLFRCVGGTVQTNLDPATHNLEEMNDADWGSAVTDLVDEMRHTPVSEILVCYDPEGAVHAEKEEKAAALTDKGGSGAAGSSHSGGHTDHHRSAASSSSALGVREFRKIYEEFWYVLGGVALTEGGMANAIATASGGGAARVSDDEEDGDHDDEGAEEEEEVENSSDDDDDTTTDDEASSSRKRKSAKKNKTAAAKKKNKKKAGKASFPTTSTAIRYDAELVRDLIGRAIELVSVGQPDVRSAALVAVYMMGQAVLDRTVYLGQKLEVATRQLAAATKAHASKAKTKRGGSGSSKVETLQHQVDSLRRTRADLDEIVMGPVIQGVFVHRYRDANRCIRAASLDALSKMTLARPDVFLMDKYLKYFGWMMSDKAEVVRLAALDGLLRPFETVHGAAESSDPAVVKAAEKIDLTLMEHVAAKFLSRMADCAVDTSTRVQERAVALLLAMLRDGFLDEVEDESIWNQVNVRALARDASPVARRDALYFVMEQLEPFDDGDDDEEDDGATATRRRRTRDGGSDSAERRTAQRLDALAAWCAHTLTDGPIPIDRIDVELADFVVHSLRAMPEHRALVTDWSAMLRAIGDDNVAMTSQGTTAGDRVDVAKQRVLVQMLATAARAEVGAVADPSFMLQDVDADVVAAETFGGDRGADAAKSKSNISGGRSSKKKGSSSTGLQHENLSIALLKALPNLLIKFKSDSAILGSLASLPRYLIPTVFSLPQRKNDFTALAKSLAEIYLQSTDETVLQNAAVSLAYLSSGDHSRAPDGRLQLKNVTQELRDRIVDLFSESPSTITDEETRTSKRKRGGSTSPNKRRRGGRSSTPSRASTAGDSTDDDDDSEDEDKANAASKEADIESAIYLNLKRLRVLSKRCDLSPFLRDDDEVGASSSDDDNGVEALCSIIADGLAHHLKARRVGATEEEDDEEDESKAESPWGHGDRKVPGIIASAVAEGLVFLLSVTAWKLYSVEETEALVVEDDDDDIMDESNEDDEDEIVDHVVLRLRNRVVALVELCFEQFLSDQTSEKEENASQPSYTPEQVAFSDTVQAAASQVVADLRNLFPKEWTEAVSPLLRALAIKEDGRIIGGFVRYFRSKEAKLRANENLENENEDPVQSLLLPMSRGLAVNWSFGNRREAGVALAHITGSGQESSLLVSSLSKCLKKVDPVRLLEAHMASLRQSYEDWMDNEPEEIDSDRPTDAEMQFFEEAEKKHEEQFRTLEHQATRFSQSLGVGKLSDPKLTPALLGFVREGVRFAFSNSDGGDDEDEWALGSRLSFLRVLSKYANWIKRNKEQKAILRDDLDNREEALRDHTEFAEVHEDDLAALAEFRAALGLKAMSAPAPKEADESVDEEDEANEDDVVSELNVTPSPNVDTPARHNRLSRGSVASSVTSRLSASRSLSPLYEEEDGSVEQQQDDEESDDEEFSAPQMAKKARGGRSQSQSQATYDPYE